MIRNLSFRNKLVLIVAPMTVALAVLLAAVARPRLAEATDARNSHNRAVLADRALRLIDELQDERALSAEYLASKGKTARDPLVARRGEADRRAEEFVSYAKQLGKTEQTRPGRAEAIEAVETVAIVRKRIDTLNQSDATSTAEYSRRIERLVDLIANVTNESTNNELVNAGQSILFHVRGKEQISRQQAIIVGRLIRGQFNASDYVDFETLRNAEKSFFDLFKSRSSGDVAALELQKKAEDSTEFRQANSVADRVSLAGRTGQVPDLPVAEYFEKTQKKVDAESAVTAGLLSSFRSRTDSISSRAQRLSVLYILFGLVGVGAALGAAVGLARSLVRRLDNLSKQAHAIATERLPEVLQTLRRPTPEALAGALPQVQSDSRDEIGVMAQSFNTVLRTSVENAIEHTERRALTMTNLLVNLGRRNQGLIEKQLGLIDRLESTQNDPEVLDGLFKLDHMVTRMRRNAENLLVLAADAPARAWADPVPVQDVFRGASSEVADLSRVTIELKSADRSVVAGRHAVDLSHLIAELVDNAMLYSPPTTKVVVRGERGTNHYRIWVIDQGVGMPEEDLREANIRLASPPDIDEMSADRVGFQVVGRIARRLGITIRLVPNPTGGIAAEVSVPLDLFESETPAPGRSSSPGTGATPAKPTPTKPPSASTRAATPAATSAASRSDVPASGVSSPASVVSAAVSPAESTGSSLAIASSLTTPARRAGDSLTPDSPVSSARSDRKARRARAGAQTPNEPAANAAPAPDHAGPGAGSSAKAPNPSLPAAPAPRAPTVRPATEYAPSSRSEPDRAADVDRVPAAVSASADDADRAEVGVDTAIAAPSVSRRTESTTRTPSAAPAPSSAPNTGADDRGAMTTTGLQKRRPGASFAGTSATAEAFDGGLYRRLPTPGDRPERSRRFGGDRQKDTAQTEDDAERRLRMLSSLKRGVEDGRDQDTEAQENV